MSAPTKSVEQPLPVAPSPSDGSRKALLDISNVAAYALPDADPEQGQGSSDPYVVFTLKTSSATFKARTSTITNASRRPKWPDVIQIQFPADLAAAPHSLTLDVAVWDEDEKDEDDIMGSISVPIVRKGAKHDRVDVKGHGRLHDFKVGFHYKLHLPAQSAPAGPGARAAVLSPRLYKETNARAYALEEGFKRNSFMMARRRRDQRDRLSPSGIPSLFMAGHRTHPLSPTPLSTSTSPRALTPCSPHSVSPRALALTPSPRPSSPYLPAPVRFTSTPLLSSARPLTLTPSPVADAPRPNATCLSHRAGMGSDVDDFFSRVDEFFSSTPELGGDERGSTPSMRMLQPEPPAALFVSASASGHGSPPPLLSPRARRPGVS